MLTWTCRAWLLLAPLALPAQDAVVTLDKWKVHDGDDARWASPGFDDTNWKASKAPEIYYSFNPFQAGFRWYRTRIELPSTLAGQPLALAVGPMDEAYEVYVEGVRAGGVGLIGVGLIKEKPEGRFEQHAAFLLPDGVSHSPRLRIAIRRWAGRGITSFAIFRARSNAGRHAPQIGRAAVISLRETIHTMDDTTASPARFVGWFLLFAGLLSLALFSTHQDRAEYLWLGLGLSTAGLGAVAGVAVAGLENLPRRAWIAVWIAGSPHIASLFSALLLRQLCPRLRQLLTAVAAIHFLDACYLMTAFRFGLPFDPQILNVGSVVTLGTQFAVAVLLGLSGLGYRLALAGSLLLQPLAATWMLVLAPWFGLQDYRYFNWQGYTVDPRAAANVLFGITVLTVLYLRFRKEQAQQLAMEQELAAGQRAQQLLLETADSQPSGYVVEKAYLPAREVGGDFYQLIAQPDGGLLVVVGDVSGKGLEAAMVAATLVGALRTFETARPGQVLAMLNRSLRRNARGGFVTCCCALFQSDGGVTLASAGHPAPYLAGREVIMEAGLPLGIVSEADYVETTVGTGVMTFVSDGVAEAANAAGELFGFERTLAISGNTAAEIAQAAKQWGQNDDITVVTVRRAV